MGIFDVLVAILLGIVEGITEWLPISSTGHMILVNQFLTFSNDDFTQMFLVVVQLGAIMAVVLLFWKKIFPFNFQYKQNNKPFVKMDIMTLWFKILVATIPAAIVGVLFDDVIDEMFYNQIVVAGALIIYGILFIIVERWNKGRRPIITKVHDIPDGDHYRNLPASGSNYPGNFPFRCNDRRCIDHRCFPWCGGRIYILSCHPGYVRSEFVKNCKKCYARTPLWSDGSDHAACGYDRSFYRIPVCYPFPDGLHS